jgi:5'-deoxynucleotidase YfbR-like HD superfamily hydrolase
MSTLNGEPHGLPTIQTFKGTYFDYSNPEASVIDIEDIAHGLANLCRFNGQSSKFYSVAQHSVLMAYAVNRSDGRPAKVFEALMHDAHEAYVGDMPSPLKRLIPGFKEIEKRVEVVVRRKFGLPESMSPEIKTADLRMLLTEQEALMTPPFNHWAARSHAAPYSGFKIVSWPPEDAKRRFLDLFSIVRSQMVTAGPEAGAPVAGGVAGSGALPAEARG